MAAMSTPLALQRTVPDVMIDPQLRSDSASGSISRTASISSGGGHLQQPTSLPSLKASGLLDVVPVEEGTSNIPQLPINSRLGHSNRHHLQSPRPPSRIDSDQYGLANINAAGGGYNMHERSRTYGASSNTRREQRRDSRLSYSQDNIGPFHPDQADHPSPYGSSSTQPPHSSYR